MKIFKNLVAGMLIFSISLLPAIDAFALGAPMSGVDMQGFYNSSGYMPTNIVWPQNMINVSGYNAAQNTNGISRHKQTSWCIPMLFASICGTTNYQSNYQLQGMGGSYGCNPAAPAPSCGYENSGWGGWYSTGGGIGMQSWIADMFTGNFSGMMSNWTSQLTGALLGTGIAAGLEYGLGGGTLTGSSVSMSTPLGATQSTSGNGPSSTTNYSQPASFSLNDPMGVVGGLGYQQNLGNGATFAGWTSISNGSPNSSAHPLSYCTGGHC